MIHCAAAGLTALCCFFNCCRQKPDQSVLGVCFVVGILHSVSRKGRGRLPRDKQMMVIYGVPDGHV